jgi:hypothetical protein
MQTLTASIIDLVVVVLKPDFKFVYVNQDGSVRELSPAEQTYLSKEFSGGDSGRPYIKSSYKSRDGWGSLSGFIERSKVPARIKVSPVHPDFDARAKELRFDMLDSHRAAGDVIETRADGSVACTPNPQISSTERFELFRNWQLAHQRERERLAMVHDPDDEANT